MRWLLTSWGSHGDLHPFLALGRGLRARGHTVTLIGHPDWAAETQAAGLRHVSTGEAAQAEVIRQYPEVLSMAWGGLVSLHTLVHRAIAPSFDSILKALLSEAPAHDVIVAHHFVFPAPVVAEITGKPLVTVSLAPGVVPSAYSLPGANFGHAGSGLAGRLGNRTVWTVGGLISRAMVDPVINKLRAKHGRRPVRDAVFTAHSQHLNLLLYSEHFAPRPPDWSAEKKIAGFCFHDPPGVTALAPEIEEFLGGGEPPVLFTLGSIAVQCPGRFYEDAVKAVRAVRRRGLLLVGPEHNRPSNLPPELRAFSYAPYGLLMPRVAAVVHQCGIGTVSHTLRAGVPSVACPFAFDQPNNARRLEALGAAKVVLPHERTAHFVETALADLFQSDAPVRARELGERIRAEDGVARACEILETTFADLPGSSLFRRR